MLCGVRVSIDVALGVVLVVGDEKEALVVIQGFLLGVIFFYF